MTKSQVGLKANVGLVAKTRPQTEERKPRLRARNLERVLGALYKAIIHERGIYSLSKMDTHAPQRFIYPGSPMLISSTNEDEHTTESFITMEEDVVNGVVAAKKNIQKSYEGRKLEPGTLEHRQWLWFATLTDRREISIRVYKAHCQIFEDHPEFYSPAVADIDPEMFAGILQNKKRYKIGSPAQSAGFWQVCARTLFEEFDGDPVNLLKHAGWSVESAYAWKKAQEKPPAKGGRGYDPIPGWGRKLISLYFLYLAELGYPLPEDAYPADMHAQAIAVQTGCVDFGSREHVNSMTLAEMLRKAITEYCTRKRYDLLLVAHASWLLGSTLCNGCSQRRDAQVLCPIYKDCRGRSDTSYYTAQGKWLAKGKVMAKGGQNPPYGIPTSFPPRVKRRRPAVVIPIKPLFG